uniref:Putative secreted protein n=1 Tax=Ixodes ricinus TaxID=34613 RepID=A0A6B0UKD3_IXORI
MVSCFSSFFGDASSGAASLLLSLFARCRFGPALSLPAAPRLRETRVLRLTAGFSASDAELELQSSLTEPLASVSCPFTGTLTDTGSSLTGDTLALLVSVRTSPSGAFLSSISE